jgi:anti-sigma-K factor RskA
VNGDLLLAAQLPPLAEDKVYQLWVIAGQDAPVGAGVFRVGSDGSGLLSLGPGLALAGVTLAVTAEPGPAGSPGPTSTVLIAGKM